MARDLLQGSEGPAATPPSPTAVAVIASHWRGPLPDVSIRRRLEIKRSSSEVEDAYAEVPASLVHGGYQGLGILIWAQLKLWFDDRGGETTYYELAEAPGVDSASPSVVNARLSIALEPMLGAWIERRPERRSMIRRWDLALLPSSVAARTQVKPADVAVFARWQQERGQRGWTAEPTKAIAECWPVTPATIRASRKRLEMLGRLQVVARDNRLSELTWLRELYDPTAELVEVTSSHRVQGCAPQPKRVGVERHLNRADAHHQPNSGPTGPSVTDLRHLRVDRWHHALVDLTESERLARGRRATRRDPHEVYLLHFPAEGCFKVGLTKSGSERIDYFSRHGDVVVQRVSVEKRPLAEISEADVLTLVEDWHVLGDRRRPGNGHTEMWADSGPTVDLDHVKHRTTELVSRLRELLAEGAL